ncbi:hypothetical protein NIES4071_105760 (plasmid) [Calothrix sp. NIES-4071]|nr:hypothetical protein NIES4071_105760 [Calothrix sp. NIES-4071]BAZ64994.1 hypothetical protein NIES4105_107270 [Calothrix sp. NIES-4105]
MGVSGSVVNRWSWGWLENEIAPQNWEDAITKVEEIIGVGMGRPKKVKSVEEISQIIELSEGHKNQKPCKSKHQHNKQVAFAAAASGLPSLSPRTIGRLLERNENKGHEAIK